MSIGVRKVKLGSGKKAINRFEALSINSLNLSVARLRDRASCQSSLYLEREGVKETGQIEHVEILPNPDEEVKGLVIRHLGRRSGRLEKIVEEEEEEKEGDRAD